MAQFNFSCALPLFPALFFFGRRKDLHDAVGQGGRGLLTMLIVLSSSARECTWVIISCTCGIGVSSICGLQVILSGSVGFQGDSPHPTQTPNTPGTRCCAQETFPLWESCFPHKHAHHHPWHSKAQSVGYNPLCSLQSFQTEGVIWETVFPVQNHYLQNNNSSFWKITFWAGEG